MNPNTSHKYAPTFIPDVAQAEKSWREERIKSFADHSDKTLRKLVRSGIPESIKTKIYSKVLELDTLNDFDKNFQSGLSRAHGPTIPDDPLPSTFGGKPHTQTVALAAPGVFVLEHTLCILAHDNPLVEFCPFVPTLTALMCHIFPNPDDVLGAMTVMLRQCKDEDDEWFYFPTSQRDVIRFGKMFGYLLSRTLPKVHKHLYTLMHSSSEPLWSEWLGDFFVFQLPQPLLWRLLDNFIVEGYKTLFRFGIALFQYHRDTILQCQNLNELHKLLHHTIHPDHYASFMKSVWNVSFSRSDLIKPKSVNAVSVEDVSSTTYRHQRAAPRKMHESSILKDFHWIALWSWIPANKRLSELQLVFTTSEHGCSLQTLYNMTSGYKPMLLLIKTMENSIFGAYLSESWPEDEEERGTFRGTGETFLFTLEPFAKLYPWVGRLEEAQPDEAGIAPVLAAPDPQASMFILSTQKEIAVGGGGSEMGLWLNASLTSGTTGPCTTFKNEPLTGNKQKQFECAVVEIFAFS